MARARRAVLAYARQHEVADLDAVAIAVSEAATNVVVHAYVGAEPGVIEVLVQRLEDDGLQVRISDTGRGMKPHLASPGLGVGLSMVGALTERYEVFRRTDGGTDLVMVFAAPNGDGPDTRLAVACDYASA